MIHTQGIRVADLSVNPDDMVILLVEDHDDFRRIVKEVLEFEGFVVRTATNGVEAINSLGAESELPHIILSDIIMEQMDGCELFARLREHALWRDIPFIFVSGRTLAEDTCDGMAALADGYLEKPFALRELLELVRQNINA